MENFAGKWENVLTALFEKPFFRKYEHEYGHLRSV